jgi:hypothetical protein
MARTGERVAKEIHEQPEVVGHTPARLILADIVAKVENRATRKISRKLIYGPLCGCVACQGH